MCGPDTLRQVTYLGQKHVCVKSVFVLFFFIMNLCYQNGTAKLWRKSGQFGRITAHPGGLPGGVADTVTYPWLMAPRPWQEVLQKWPVRARRSGDRCFEFRALLQGEEKY